MTDIVKGIDKMKNNIKEWVEICKENANLLEWQRERWKNLNTHDVSDQEKDEDASIKYHKKKVLISEIKELEDNLNKLNDLFIETSNKLDSLKHNISVITDNITITFEDYMND